MRLFVCLLHLDGMPIRQVNRRAYEAVPREYGLTYEWDESPGFATLVAGEEPQRASMHASYQAYTGVGDVRLDNRPDLERWSGSEGQGLSDLALTLRVIALHGTNHVPEILGDFAFAVWHAPSARLFVACDAFSVKKLFYASHCNLMAFASRAEILALKEDYDVQHLAEIVAFCDPTPGRSPYMNVSSLPPGSMGVVNHGKLTTQRYWSAHDFEQHLSDVQSEREAAEACRDLLGTAVRLRLTGGKDTWSQLSGGLDSSSVVSMAQWLAEQGAVRNGVGGTISWVDTHGTGADEREYSNAVIERFRLRNETLVDEPLWADDDLGLPKTDEPSASYPFYARDRQLCLTARRGGARVLLTGVGGDQLFVGNMLFFADWIAKGHIRRALVEMARRAAIGRVSFWDLAYKNGLLPLMPRVLQDRLVRGEGQVPPWVRGDHVRRYDLRSRSCALLGFGAPIGRKYSDSVAAFVAATPASLTTGVIEDALDVRHPYLYRPLVEFALRLPPEWCVRPHARKWILREAMRGILPEVVRTRVGKGVMYGLMAWSVVRQRDRLEPLLNDPILAQLGVIDPAKLRAGFAAAQFERDRTQEYLYAGVQSTLAVEAWLRVRSGRWPGGRFLCNPSAGNQETAPRDEESAGRNI
jgi:asparagine synthase (glutamine-hydrolysing)